MIRLNCPPLYQRAQISRRKDNGKVSDVKRVNNIVRVAPYGNRTRYTLRGSHRANHVVIPKVGYRREFLIRFSGKVCFNCLLSMRANTESFRKSKLSKQCDCRENCGQGFSGSIPWSGKVLLAHELCPVYGNIMLTPYYMELITQMVKIGCTLYRVITAVMCVYKPISSYAHVAYAHDTQTQNNNLWITQELFRAGIAPATHCTAASYPATTPTTKLLTHVHNKSIIHNNLINLRSYVAVDTFGFYQSHLCVTLVETDSAKLCFFMENMRAIDVCYECLGYYFKMEMCPVYGNSLTTYYMGLST
uniref:SFRICE_013287 n=1 Tax=Spodoptera frugiperda TaxID=7108 RepID=A0A2H1V3L7_SPOFR